MANKQVTVVVRLRAKAGMETHVQQELSSLLAPTRREQGCIETPHITRWIREAKALLASPWN